MNREEELKEELERIQKEKAQAEIDKNLDEMKLVGKCYSSHSIARNVNVPNYQFNVYKIIDKFYDKDTHYGDSYKYKILTVRVHKRGDDIFDVHKGHSTLQRIDGMGKYEITEAEFDRVSQQFTASFETSIQELRKDFKMDIVINNGQYTDFNCMKALLDKSGIDFIDLADNDYNVKGERYTIVELLSWQRHPYLYGNKLYLLPNCIEMIKMIRDDMYKAARSWGGSIYERDMPRISILDRFITDNSK